MGDIMKATSMFKTVCGLGASTGERKESKCKGGKKHKRKCEYTKLTSYQHWICNQNVCLNINVIA